MALERNVKKKPARTHDRRNVWLLVLTTLLVIVSVALFTPPSQKINQGLDVQGGLSVVLSAESTNGEAVTAEDMEKSRAIIESRVNALGASEAVVQLQGDDQILVQIPGMTDTQEALETIGKTGSLSFARLDSFTDETAKMYIQYGYYANEETVTDDFGNSFGTGDMTYMEVTPGTYTPLITGDQITNVTVDLASDVSTEYAVNLTLNSEASKAFAEATAELAPTNGQIVIILDNEVQCAPAVQSEITGGQVSITGGYTLEEAKALQTVLESGSLPVNFSVEQSQTVGPTLGQEALKSGILVALVGLGIVMLYLLFFYKGLGLINAGAMLVFAVLYLGLLAGLSAFNLFSLSLAGIAGIVLTIGMAADSSILTVERFREEIRMGRSVRAASITGVRHAIQTSIDADLVTLVSALTLFFLGSASVKGFGLTLALGILCDILMMLIFKAPLIRLLAPKAIAANPGFWGIRDSLAAAEYGRSCKAERSLPVGVSARIRAEEAAEKAPDGEGEGEAGAAASGTGASASAADAALSNAAAVRGRFIKRDINFMGHRKVFLTVAAVLVVASFAVMGLRGFNFGIEFVGGTSVAFHNTGEVTTEQMRTAFDDAGEPDAVIQTTSSDGEEGFLVRTTTVSAEEAAASATQVASELGLSADSFEVTTIGPDWGASVIKSSIIAFVVSLLLIIAYIAFRFEYKMGVMAIVALLHDIIIVVGVYALVGREISPNAVAALLTILGYSLYDKIVVFHRINDNMQGDEIRCTFFTMANHSINQVFIRTINTTTTSLIPVLAMLFFGGETLKDFAFAMALGLVIGSYSSIAVATPLYCFWKTREPKFAKLQKKYGEGVDLFEFDHAGTTGIASVPLARIEADKKAAAKAEKEAAREAVRDAAKEPAAEAAKGSAPKSGKSKKKGSGKKK